MAPFSPTFKYIDQPVKNFLNLGPDPCLPLKVKKDQNLFFFLWWPKYFLQKKNLKNSTNWVNIMNIFQVLVVRRGHAPVKKIFSAYLNELAYEKIKIKKLRKWGKFVLTLPPC